MKAGLPALWHSAVGLSFADVLPQHAAEPLSKCINCVSDSQLLPPKNTQKSVLPTALVAFQGIKSVSGEGEGVR